MSDPFVGEIRIFPFNFPPKGWAFCAGQLMPISQNTALFSLLGTFYGGDGKSTFALPDMQNNVAIQQGQGQGLSLYDLGQIGGVDNITLLTSEIPAHQHLMQAAADPGDVQSPAPDRVLARTNPGFGYDPAIGGSPAPVLAVQALAPNGGGLPHNNMMPYLTLNYCIALQGIFPARP